MTKGKVSDNEWPVEQNNADSLVGEHIKQLEVDLAYIRKHLNQILGENEQLKDEIAEWKLKYIAVCEKLESK